LRSDGAHARAAGEDGAPGGAGVEADGEDGEGEEDEAALDALLADAQRMAGGRRGKRARFREPGSDADDASDEGGADGAGPSGADATYADLFGGGGARRARRHSIPQPRAGRFPPTLSTGDTGTRAWILGSCRRRARAARAVRAVGHA